MGGEIKVQHVVEEEARIEEMMTMRNLNMGMIMISPNIATVVVIIEASIKKRDLGNLSLPCQNLMVDLILKIISHGN
jgi:N-acetylglutamate synthase/N-acetylornithine aminotransferase